jgi:PPM family protein phosphatase
MMEIQAWALSDVGRVRDHNEDSFLSEPSLGLFVVADGMGGHAAGEVASQTSVAVIRDAITRAEPLLKRFRDKQDESDRRQILSLLEQVIQESCAKIHDMGQKDQKRRGMGTTTSIMLCLGRRGFVAHVGDSRIYLHRQGQIHQLTEDHSVIQELIKRGRLKKEDAEKSPYRNAVTRAVGIYASVEVDTLDLEILPGDTFLLCSDGLSGYLKETELLPLLAEADATKLPKTLIDIANQRGGKDNITAVVVRASEEATQTERPTASYKLRMETLKNTPLFKFCTHNELLRLSSLMRYRRFDSGDALVREGDLGDELFVLLAGQVKLIRDEQILSRHRAGDSFGEMSLVTRAPRSATLLAEGDVEAMTLARKDFFDILKNEDPLAVKLLWQFVLLLADRLKVTTAKLVARGDSGDTNGR